MGVAASFTSVPPKDPLAFPTRGVKLSHAQAFLQEHAGKLAGKTTTEVCEEIIKPLTLAHGCSYCDLLDAMSHDAVGEAEVFISHAWKFQFLDVVEALQIHFQDQNPDIVIWLDLFSNNQHDTGSKPNTWWSGVFKDAIGRLQHCVMVLAPWNNPIPLTRAWCLFELYCAFNTGASFEIAMSATERAKFRADIRDGVVKVADTMLAKVDVRKSECYHSEDKQNILNAVEQLFRFNAFNAFNAKVKAHLKKWMLLQAKPVPSAAGEDNTDFIECMLQYGVLLMDEGLYMEAEAILAYYIEKSEAVLGVEHAITVWAIEKLSTLYCEQGGLFFRKHSS